MIVPLSVVDGGCKTHAEKRMVMYVIAFFAPEFGFVV
jgi:hypothetical protein